MNYEMQFEVYDNVEKLIKITKSIFSMFELAKQREIEGKFLTKKEIDFFLITLDVENTFYQRCSKDFAIFSAMFDCVGKLIDIEKESNPIYDRILSKMGDIMDSISDDLEEENIEYSKVPTFSFFEQFDGISFALYGDDLNELEKVVSSISISDKDENLEYYYGLVRVLDEIMDTLGKIDFLDEVSLRQIHFLEGDLLKYKDQLNDKINVFFKNSNLYKQHVVKEAFDQDFLVDTYSIYDKILSDPSSYPIDCAQRKFLIERKYSELLYYPILEKKFIEESLRQEKFIFVRENFKIYQLASSFYVSTEVSRMVHDWESIVIKKVRDYEKILDAFKRGSYDDVTLYVYQEQLKVLRSYLSSDTLDMLDSKQKKYV